MATIALTRNNLSNLLCYTSGTCANGDNTANLSGDNCDGYTVLARGTQGAGFAWQIEASDDGTNFIIVGTSQSAVGVIPAAVSGAFVRMPFLRARITAGDGTTAIVFAFCGPRTK